MLDYPAAYDGVIAVGATGLHDNDTGEYAGSTEYVAPYSQYGPGLSVVAPGGDPRRQRHQPAALDLELLDVDRGTSRATSALRTARCP